MPGYIERIDGDIASVQLSEDVFVPLEMLTAGISVKGEVYRMHPLGGGLVADSSFVPDDVSVPLEIIVHRDTRVLTSMGMAGLHNIWGDVSNPDVSNPNEISRFMDDEARKLRNEQRLMGVVARVLEIERRQQITQAAAPTPDTLF